jgi:CBS domain-containing protein
MVSDTVGSILRHKGREVWSIEPSASVLQAISLMADRSIGAVLVMSDGQLVGIMSERDYARKVVLLARVSNDTLVAEIMTSPVIVVGPQQTVEECMRLMTQKRIRHLPVVDQGQVIGIVSIGDLVRKVVTTQGEMIQHLQEYIAGRSLTN